MSLAIPARPYSRSPGSCDHVVAMLEAPHIANEAAPGVTLHVRGWIADPQFNAVEQAWVEIAGAFVPVELDRNRLDVARTFGTRDREGRRLGFDAMVVLPENVEPGTYDARVIGRTRSGSGIYAETAQRVAIAHPRVAPKACVAASAVRFGLRLRDTQLAAYTLGRGPFTIRQESSLHISGFVDGAEFIHVQARSAITADVYAWEFPAVSAGRFDALLWLGDLDRGLYELTLCRASRETIIPVATCGFDIAGPHYLAPLNLTTMLAEPLAAVTTLSDVGPAAAASLQSRLIAGRPLGVCGWCLDPVSQTPPLAVYVQIDAKRPIPLSHHLRDPRPDRPSADVRCGFGGIIDTTRLDPGTHRLRLLAAAVSGAGWYVIDEREIELLHHRGQSLSGGIEPARSLPSPTP